MVYGLFFMINDVDECTWYNYALNCIIGCIIAKRWLQWQWYGQNMKAQSLGSGKTIRTKTFSFHLLHFIILHLFLFHFLLCWYLDSSCGREN